MYRCRTYTQLRQNDTYCDDGGATERWLLARLCRHLTINKGVLLVGDRVQFRKGCRDRRTGGGGGCANCHRKTGAVLLFETELR